MTRATTQLRRAAGLVIILIGAFFAYRGTISSASQGTAETAAEAAVAQAPRRVESIIFVGQKEACECTRNRIDTSWQVLQTVLQDGPELPVKRIQRDVDVDDAEKLSSVSPLMVAPGIYFLDEHGEVVTLLQGEVREDQIAALLQQ